MTMYISISDVRRVRWLEFKRPPVNAFNRQMVEETRDAIAAATVDPSVRVIVIASTLERYFSAGATSTFFVE